MTQAIKWTRLDFTDDDLGTKMDVNRNIEIHQEEQAMKWTLTTARTRLDFTDDDLGTKMDVNRNIEIHQEEQAMKWTLTTARTRLS